MCPTVKKGNAGDAAWIVKMYHKKNYYTIIKPCSCLGKRDKQIIFITHTLNIYDR